MIVGACQSKAPIIMTARKRPMTFLTGKGFLFRLYRLSTIYSTLVAYCRISVVSNKERSFAYWGFGLRLHWRCLQTLLFTNVNLLWNVTSTGMRLCTLCFGCFFSFRVWFFNSFYFFDFDWLRQLLFQSLRITLPCHLSYTISQTIKKNQKPINVTGNDLKILNSISIKCLNCGEMIPGIAKTCPFCNKSPVSVEAKEDPLDILKMRYAKGEITGEQYEKIREKLEKQ